MVFEIQYGALNNLIYSIGKESYKGDFVIKVFESVLTFTGPTWRIYYDGIDVFSPDLTDIKGFRVS